MEGAFQAHPVPQNVTNFEFHLVGDMTIKQFGYLAAGLGIAFLLFVTLAQPLPIVAWPLIVISAATGAAFSFLPIQERPLDHWVAAFFRAIFKPTKLGYDEKLMKKTDPFFGKRMGMYLNTHMSSIPPILPASTTVNAVSQSGKKQSLADRILANGDNIRTQVEQDKEIDSLVAQQLRQQATAAAAPVSAAPPTSPAPAVQPPIPVAHENSQPPLSAPAVNPLPGSNVLPAAQAASQPPIPQGPVVVNNNVTTAPVPDEGKGVNVADLKKTVELAKDAQDTQAKIRQIEVQLNQIKSTVAKPGADPKYYIEQFESLLSDLQKLNLHASETAHDLAVVSKTADTQPQKVVAAAPAKSIPTVKLTSFPNVVNGIVTDSQGNYVEGAIIVAHDKQGLPVRALKSNKLGQFVAATPLPSGTFTIVAEKEGLMFDNISIELKNDILQPVMLSAKRQQIIAGVTGTV